MSKGVRTQKSAGAEGLASPKPRSRTPSSRGKRGRSKSPGPVVSSARSSTQSSNSRSQETRSKKACMPKGFYVWMLVCNFTSSSWQTLYYLGVFPTGLLDKSVLKGHRFTLEQQVVFCELLLATFKMGVELVYGDWRRDRWDLHAHHLLAFAATALCLGWVNAGFDGARYAPLLVHGLSIHYAMVFSNVKRIAGAYLEEVSSSSPAETVSTVRRLDSAAAGVLLCVWLPVVAYRSLGICLKGFWMLWEQSPPVRVLDAAPHEGGMAPSPLEGLLVVGFGILFLVLDLRWTRWELYRDCWRSFSRLVKEEERKL